MTRLSEDLLRKFHAGKCTDAEYRQVMHWLENHREENMLSLPEDRMEEIESRIWANINPEKKKERRGPTSLLSMVPVYRIAASIVVLLMIGWFGMRWQRVHTSAPVVYTLNSDTQKSMDVHGLNFTLANNSQAVVVQDPGRGQRDITFCGAVQITNNTGAEIRYSFESSCKKTAYTRKQITFQPGQTYIAVHNYYKTDEVIIMRKERMIEFPDAISSDVVKEFSI